MSDSRLQRMAIDAGLPPQVLSQALEWLVTAWSREATAAELAALECWRAAKPEHEQAWQQVQRISARMAALSPVVAATSLRAARAFSTDRRRAMRVLALFAMTGAGAHVVRGSRAVRAQFAGLRTATGEVRELTLDDGTQITLNTRSALELSYTDTERRLHLIDGEVLVVTAKDAAPKPRPFIVETAHGTAVPIGTRFTVRSQDERSTVAVYEGAVRIHPRDAAAPLRVERGQQASFTAHSAEAASGADQTRVAWTRGLLIAEGQRLCDFLRELGRYRGGVIRCDPAVAGLIVSGTYPIADTDRVLAALARALPVTVHGGGRYWVVVEPA